MRTRSEHRVGPSKGNNLPQTHVHPGLQAFLKPLAPLKVLEAFDIHPDGPRGHLAVETKIRYRSSRGSILNDPK